MKLHCNSGRRMREIEFGSVQELSGHSARQFLGPAMRRPAQATHRVGCIGLIADHRVTEMEQVNPDLMRAPGLKLGTKQISGSPAFDAAEMRDGVPTALDDGHALTVIRR